MAPLTKFKAFQKFIQIAYADGAEAWLKASHNRLYVASVRVFDITRTTRVPYVFYLTHDGRSVPEFINLEILSKFKGCIGYKEGSLIVTNLATGSEQVDKLEYSDRTDKYIVKYLGGCAA